MALRSYDPLWQSTQTSGAFAYVPWTPSSGVELLSQIHSSPSLFSQTLNSPLSSRETSSIHTINASQNSPYHPSFNSNISFLPLTMPSTDNSSIEIVSDSRDTEDDIEIEMSLRRSTGVERTESPATGPSSSQVSESHPRDMAQRSANGNEAVDQGGTTDPQRLHLQLMETLHQLTQKVDAAHQDRARCVSAKSKLKDAEEELKKMRKDKQQMAEEIGRLKSDLSTAQSKLRSQEVILDERSCALATERAFRQHLEES